MTRIALIQQPASEDRQQNRERGLVAAESAVRNGAKIICFAELAFDRFYPQHHADATSLSNAEVVPGPTTAMFAALARKHGVVIVLNLFERKGERTFDSSPVLGPDGELMGTTRMVHITDYPLFHETEYYHPGSTEPQIYHTPFGKVGVAICYDRHFPEYMRQLGICGADIVFVPQAGVRDEWPEGLYHAELQVASFQNGYFTALCNRVGREDALDFAGESFVCDPSGRIIASADSGTEEILYADLDLEMVEKSHARRLFFRDRRPPYKLD